MSAKEGKCHKLWPCRAAIYGETWHGGAPPTHSPKDNLLGRVSSDLPTFLFDVHHFSRLEHAQRRANDNPVPEQSDPAVPGTHGITISMSMGVCCATIDTRDPILRVICSTSEGIQTCKDCSRVQPSVTAPSSQRRSSCTRSTDELPSPLHVRFTFRQNPCYT